MRLINFQALTIRRMVSHTILEKQPKDQTSTADVTDELLAFDFDQQQLILKRLQDAIGRRGKAFKLEIEDSAPSSFFGHCVDLNKVDNKGFVKRTQDLAHKLAGKQSRANIKAGYLMFIEAIDSSFGNTPVYIVIKAEPHEGLRRNASSLEHLKDIVMTPSQKLYKVGMLYLDDNEGKVYPNDSYSAYLFDDQFNTDATLSLYFSRDFLSFGYKNNGPIQTKNFYEKTQDFLNKNIKDDDKREELADALRVLIQVSTAETIYPRDFAKNYLETEEQRALFSATVLKDDFPEAIKKDTILLDSAMKTRKVKFKDVQISGLDSNFGKRVQVIKNKSVLENLDPNSPAYTILKIEGKPNTVERNTQANRRAKKGLAK